MRDLLPLARRDLGVAAECLRAMLAPEGEEVAEEARAMTGAVFVLELLAEIRAETRATREVLVKVFSKPGR